MKVFISWSGDRSKKLAEFLAGWLRKLPLTIEPWVSKEAIDPGTRWGKELAEALEGTSFGILCITTENQKEPWINFEAGALSKTIEKTYVVPYLIGMNPSQIEQPLKQFQACEANEEGTWKLIETIYEASGDKTRSIDDLDESFKMWWQKLSKQIDEAKNEGLGTSTVSEEPSMTDIKSSLDKILTVLESLSSRITGWESEFFSGETGSLRSSLRQSQRRIRDEISSLKNSNDSRLNRLGSIEIFELAKFLNEIKKLRSKQESSPENNEAKE